MAARIRRLGAAPVAACATPGPGDGLRCSGFAFGLAFFGATLYWILRFGEMAWVALTVISRPCQSRPSALLAPSLRRHGRPLITALGSASLWTVMEWLEGMWPLGGFTWGTLGVSQVDNRATVRLGDGRRRVGRHVRRSWRSMRAPDRRGRRTVGASANAPPPWPWRPSSPSRRWPCRSRRRKARTIDVATLQVDVRSRSRRRRRSDEDVRRRADCTSTLHRRLAGGPPPDLVVWGEGALDPAAAADAETFAAVRDRRAPASARRRSSARS